MSRVWMFVALALALSGGLLLALYLQREAPIRSALYYEQPRTVPAFSLTSHSGEVFDNAALDNRWTLLSIGYTFCPDVCPTALADLARWHEQLPGALRDELQVLFVSVDPERDTPQRLADYIRYFHPQFIAATGEHSQLYPLTQAMGLLYAIGEPVGDTYSVDHSASLVLLNPAGQIQALFRPQINQAHYAGVDLDALSQDLPAIIARWRH